MKIKIRGVEYELRYSLRALFIYEQITGKRYEEGDASVNDFLLFYSYLLASNKNFPLDDFDAFIDVCDEDPTLYATFAKWITSEIQRVNKLFPADDSKKKAK
ncbi:hypothetical protein [Parabacteroides sp. Marseille-P3160]|uniref:hypothetical protein n=1 Tax=Parabacteroides sp. Marseille-P3160 TaxID=1917887 RepID=UPI0009BC5C11|nr:hypothetical protein [Parabacteroides sp. Marseille-P3160]